MALLLCYTVDLLICCSVALGHCGDWTNSHFGTEKGVQYKYRWGGEAVSRSSVGIENRKSTGFDFDFDFDPIGWLVGCQSARRQAPGCTAPFGDSKLA